MPHYMWPMLYGDATYRTIEVPDAFDGMRLDRFLARRFPERSRSWLVDGIRAGLVKDADGNRLRPSTRLRADQALLLLLPGIAPGGPPPDFPPILHMDDRVIVVDKPAGLMVQPSGNTWVWALIGLAKARWKDERIDLVHRLDRETSGVILLSRDLDANRFLKKSLHDGWVHKEYEALCRGRIPWDRKMLEGAIGPDGGVVRLKMAVRDDGQRARTEVDVLDRCETMSRVRCVLHTGRTHQIRVHLFDAGFPLVGDVLYGPQPEVFLHRLDHGNDAWVRERAGAPHHALHARQIRFPHPDGGEVEVAAPVPAALERWWAHPEVLPHDGLDD